MTSGMSDVCLMILRMKWHYWARSDIGYNSNPIARHMKEEGPSVEMWLQNTFHPHLRPVSPPTPLLEPVRTPAVPASAGPLSRPSTLWGPDRLLVKSSPRWKADPWWCLPSLTHSLLPLSCSHSTCPSIFLLYLLTLSTPTMYFTFYHTLYCKVFVGGPDLSYICPMPLSASSS